MQLGAVVFRCAKKRLDSQVPPNSLPSNGLSANCRWVGIIAVDCSVILMEQNPKRTPLGKLLVPNSTSSVPGSETHVLVVRPGDADTRLRSCFYFWFWFHSMQKPLAESDPVYTEALCYTGPPAVRNNTQSERVLAQLKAVHIYVHALSPPQHMLCVRRYSCIISGLSLPCHGFGFRSWAARRYMRRPPHREGAGLGRTARAQAQKCSAGTVQTRKASRKGTRTRGHCSDFTQKVRYRKKAEAKPLVTMF